MLWKRIAVRNQERVLIARNGRFHAILTPGSHRVFTPPGVSLDLERFNIRDLVFQSSWANYLVANHPDVVEQHFVAVKTNSVQVAMVYANGKLVRILTPSKCVLFWRDFADITAEIVEVIEGSGVEPDDSGSALEALLENLT